VEPAGGTVDGPLVAVPASRISVDARGAALGILAALALIFALSWGEKFMVPLLLGIACGAIATAGGIARGLIPLVASLPPWQGRE